MENVIKQLTLKNYMDIINNVSYGTMLVSYLNDSVRVEVADAIKTINEIAGLEVIREVEHTEGWEETPVPGVYAVIYSDRDNPVPQITEDDMNISCMVKRALQEQSMFRLNVNLALWKRVKKECKAIGVKFSTDYDDVCVIDGRKKSQSVYKRIQEAYNNGMANVSFNVDEVNPPTVRTYASQFGAAVGLKIRCTGEPGFITVHFREADPKDVLLQELKLCVGKIAAFGVTYTELQDRIMKSMWEVYGEENSVDENELPEAPAYIKAGFDNESDYLDYLSEQKESQPDIIKEVEGLQQYVMPIADTEPKKPTVEYDDF